MTGRWSRPIPSVFWRMAFRPVDFFEDRLLPCPVGHATSLIGKLSKLSMGKFMVQIIRVSADALEHILYCKRKSVGHKLARCHRLCWVFISITMYLLKDNNIVMASLLFIFLFDLCKPIRGWRVRPYLLTDARTQTRLSSLYSRGVGYVSGFRWIRLARSKSGTVVGILTSIGAGRILFDAGL